MYKYHLNDVEWGEFFIETLFYVVRGNASNLSIRELEAIDNKSLPIISAKDKNNAILGFTTKKEKERCYKNVITINNNGSVGYSFYHVYEFVASSDVSILKSVSNSLNQYNSIFIINCLQNIAVDKFAYGYKASNERLRRTKIVLPVDGNNNPNWYFMEEYIKERENKQREDLREYYNRRLLDLVVCPEVLTDVEWGEFSLRDIFVFERGNQNNMSACEAGDIPLISAKKIDNGVKAFISDNGKKLFEGHILTLNNDGDGGVGIAYYQANKMALDTHVTALIPIIPINRSSLLFISKTITIQRDKFSHGYSLNNNRMKAQKIVLPIDKNGNPNWTYMENFIKNVEQKQIKNILKYLDEYIYIYI
ncbi:restriction endonuclease subunit S [Streptobacillus moniliformis]|uniref:restriction endonuclease subunit S n=1 Tax=Streptobacillus moniliformis TaxID=34105 RepID=UPI000A692D30|nr:restriction endonuclease subunit S [Streptobacillus moniliformis]